MPHETISRVTPSLRPYTSADESAVLDLINGDRLPGQPPTTADMLAEALAGRSPVDGGWWDELATPVTDVVHDAGAVLGAARVPGGGLVLLVTGWAMR